MPRKPQKGFATLYIRIESAIYDKLAELAKVGRRPLAAQVAIVLEDGLRKQVSR